MQDIHFLVINYLTILLLVLLPLSLLEVCLDGFPKIQKQIYYVAFAFAAIWCTIKFAIGPDIMLYLDYYNNLHDVAGAIVSRERIEIGFAAYCGLCKILNLSYWGMTAVISVLFFIAVAITIHHIPIHKTVALTTWLLLDYNLVLYEHRQCLAVSLLILAYWLWKNKRYVWMVIFMAIACTMHKSAVLVVMIAALIYLLRGLQIDKKAYLILSVLFLCLLLLPIHSVWSGLISFIPLPSSLKISISHHLITGKVVQLILPFYLTVLGCLAYYVTAKKTENKTYHWIIFCCITIFILLYQSWFLLNRLRSYMLPFLLVYIINLLYNTEIKDKIPRQILTIVFFLYAGLFTYGNAYRGQQLVSRCNNISTVFERKYHNDAYLENRQKKEAIRFWTYDHEEKLFGSQD